MSDVAYRASAWPRPDGSTITLGELQDTAQEVAPKLWQGGFHAAKLVEGLNPDVICNLTPLGRSAPLDFKGLYIEFPFDDGEQLPDPETLHPLVDLLAELHYQGKTLLIHCEAGLNRSGLVTALVLRARSCSADDAIGTLRARRDPFVLCNADFERYVKEWAV